MNIPARIKKKRQITEPDIRFKISDMCIHPLTKKLYVISDSDYLLFLFDMKGNIERMEPLNPVLFNKADGIAV